MIEYRYLVALLSNSLKFALKKDCKDMHHFLNYKPRLYICLSQAQENASLFYFLP